MYYENFERLCAQNGVKPADVSRATEIATATLSEWKKGSYTPKQDKLAKIADYFNVSLEFLTTGKNAERLSTDGTPYYFSDETAAAAQEIFDNKDLKMLFDAASDAKPENLRLAAEMLRRFKESNPDG